MTEVTPKCVFASLPRTTRGVPIVLGGDPKSKNFLYTNNNSVFIRNVSNPSECDVYTQHQCQVVSAQYSPSGFYIASGDASGKVRIWDTVNREHILKNEFQPLGGSVKDIAWSGDNQRIAVCGEGREKFAHVFAADTGTSVGDLGGSSKSCNSVAFRGDRPFKIVIGSEDFKAAFYQGPPFKFVKTMNEHTNFVNSVRYAPDGSVFITAGAEGKAYVYDGKTGDLIGELGAPAHKGGIYAVAFNPNSSEVLTVSGDKTVKIWNVANRELVTTFEVGKTVDEMLVGALWQGDAIIAVALSGYIYYFDRNNPGSPLRIIYGHNKPITAMALSEDRTQIYTADQNARTVCWNAASGESAVFTGKGHSNQVQDMVVTNGNLVSVGMDDTIRFTDLSNNQFGDNSTKLDSMPKAVAAGGSVVAVASINHVTVFKNGSKLLSQGVKFEPSCVDVSSNGSLVAVGGDQDRKVHIFDISSGGLSEVNVIACSGSPTCVRFSADGQYIAVGESDRYLRLYSMSDLKTAIIEYMGHTAKVTCVAWSPDSSRLATGGLDSQIVIWDPNQPMSPKVFRRAHAASYVNKIAWLNDSVVISAGQDSNVKLWDV